MPMIEEFAERYDVDAIHHDYVRYPGDLAPDTYCFCYYCFDAIPRYASYYAMSRPDDPLLAPMDRPHLEAHWVFKNPVQSGRFLTQARLWDSVREFFGR